MLVKPMALTRRLGRGPTDHSSGWVALHPQAADWLAGHGLTTADDFLELPGEVVSGHVTRHVMQVRLGGRTLYLKREHRVRWRERWSSWWAGFGRASKSEREGRLLWELERERLPAPRCLAFGEDGRGRAFLLIEEATGSVELQRLLSEQPESADNLAERLGQAVAEVHAAGFDHPDLCMKHVLVHPETQAITLLDWQRSRRFRRLSWAQRIRSLAALHATLAEELATPTVRLRFLWAYLRVARAATNTPHFGLIARQVMREAVQRRKRYGVREQLPPFTQRLVWLDGEALCAIPEVAGELSSESVRAQLYEQTNQPAAIRLPGGQRARLQVGRRAIGLGRLGSAVRGRAWRSPEMRQARVLFHLERHGIPAPRLLAFGQRGATGLASVESFVLTDNPRSPVPLRLWWNACCTGTTATARSHRVRTIDGLAVLLRRLHDAGCTGDSLGAFAAQRSGLRWQIVLDDVARVHLCRRVDHRQVLTDLRRLWRTCRDAVGRADVLRFLVRYARGKGTSSLRRLLDEI